MAILELSGDWVIPMTTANDRQPMTSYSHLVVTNNHTLLIFQTATSYSASRMISHFLVAILLLLLLSSLLLLSAFIKRTFADATNALKTAVTR